MQSLKEWATYTTGFIVRWLSCGINVCERFVSCCCCSRFVVLENKFTYAIGVSERALACVWGQRSAYADYAHVKHTHNVKIVPKNALKKVHHMIHNKPWTRREKNNNNTYQTEEWNARRCAETTLHTDRGKDEGRRKTRGNEELRERDRALKMKQKNKRETKNATNAIHH